MKYTANYTCRLAIALLLLSGFTANADERTPSDTLVVQLENNNHIRIVANSFKDLSKYSRADSLLAVFATDAQRAHAGKSYSEWPKVMHYLMTADGKRRLKMQNDEFTEGEFNLEKEKYRLHENIPAYHYTVYDLASETELHLYLERAENITLLQQHSIDSAIQALAQWRKQTKRYYNVQLLPQQHRYALGKTKGELKRTLEFSPDINAYLIGNQWTPTIGFEAKVVLSNKYGTPYLSAGGAMMSYVFSDFSAGKFNGFTHNIGYDLRLSFNMNDMGGKPLWFGVEGGIITAPEKELTEGFTGTAYRFALVTELHGLGFSFGGIRDSYKRGIPTIGIRLPF